MIFYRSSLVYGYALSYKEQLVPTWAMEEIFMYDGLSWKQNVVYLTKLRKLISDILIIPIGMIVWPVQNVMFHWRPGDLTWSVLGLSGNIVTIFLMAGLLASLHWLLVVLALGSLILIIDN